MVLKTMVFMPGELVCEVGDISNEMYFIVEGQLERRYAGRMQEPEEVAVLKKGDYYGEIALLTVSVFSEQVQSVGFSILESLTRFDFQKLKHQFPSLEESVQKSLLRRRLAAQSKFVAALSCALPFQGIAEELLQVLLEKYLEDKFFPNEHTIFSPDDKYEDLYIIFNGSVDYCLSGPSFQKNRKKEYEDLDDYIHFNELQGFIKYSSQNQYLEFQSTLGKYLVFGFLNPELEDTMIMSDQFLVCSSACYVGVISSKLLKIMQLNDPQLYEALINNLLVLETGLRQGLIEDDDYQHFTKFHRSPKKKHHKPKDDQDIDKLNLRLIEAYHKLSEQNDQITRLQQWVDIQFTKQEEQNENQSDSSKVIIF